MLFTLCLYYIALCAMYYYAIVYLKEHNEDTWRYITMGVAILGTFIPYFAGEVSMRTSLRSRDQMMISGFLTLGTIGFLIGMAVSE